MNKYEKSQGGGPGERKAGYIHARKGQKNYTNYVISDRIGSQDNEQMLLKSMEGQDNYNFHENQH